MKIKTKLISIFLSLSVFVLFFVLGLVFKAQADSVSGWLWGGSEDANIGTADGTVNGNETGAGFISMNGTGYGVDAPTSDGNLSGYAWGGNEKTGEGIGWIDFSNTSCPTGVSANCTARRVGNNLAGYARIVAIKTELEKPTPNSGGWEGFIDLSGINISGGNFSGYGWNGETAGSGNNYADGLGWIDFSGSGLKFLEIDLFYANPPNGYSPFKPNFYVSINTTTSTATGNDVTYELDCTNDGSYDATYNSTTGETNHTFSSPCTYMASANASARIIRGGATSDPRTATVLVDVCICGTNDEVCSDKTYTNGCGVTCPGTKDCSVPGWKEVAP